MSFESRCQQYGTVFHHWQIRDILGGGSKGKTAVFRLVHKDTSNVQSAMKVVNLIETRGSYSALSEARKRAYDQVKEQCKQKAQQEVLLMNTFQGRTNIVDYLDHTFIDWEDSGSFGCDLLIRMELLHDLRNEILDDRCFPSAEVVKLGKDICNALILCHRKNIMHRDIKPENIFFNEDGNYKLGDFGISRILDSTPLSAASTGIGTLQYLAPEQTSGKYDKRVDIYSLGLVLYELMNRNRLPFADNAYITESEVQKRLTGAPLPAPVNADRAFSKVILKACAYRPEDRYQTIELFLAALEDVACGILSPVQSKISPTSVVLPHQTYATQPAQNQGKAVCPAINHTEPVKSTKKDQHDTIQTSPSYQTEPTEAFSSTGNGNFGKKTFRQLLLLIAAIVLLFILITACISSCSPEKQVSNGPSTTTGTPDEPAGNSDFVIILPDDNTYDPTSPTLPQLNTSPSSSEPAATVPEGETASPTEAVIEKQPDVSLSGSNTTTESVTTTTASSKVVLQEIAVKTLPSTKNYYVGDKLSTSGLTLNAKYSDGSVKGIKSGLTCSPTQLDTAGNQTITVQYDGKKTTFQVQVVENWSDWVTKLPSDINRSSYEIQEKNQYSSAKIKSWRTLTDGMMGLSAYDIYDRTEYNTTVSDWSPWRVEGENNSLIGGIIGSTNGGYSSYYYSREEEREDAVQYRYRDLISTSNEYGEWSEWQSKAVSATNTRQIETRAVYRVRTVTVHSTRYYYQIDGSWGPYIDTPIEKNESTAVRTRTVYRYRKKLA